LEEGAACGASLTIWPPKDFMLPGSTITVSASQVGKFGRFASTSRLSTTSPKWFDGSHPSMAWIGSC
jgi:hypothetical protein